MTGKSDNKLKGRVYTPEFIVNDILDLCEYNTQIILKKHVIDNSCGDGAFLAEVVRRYCHAAINMPTKKLAADLSKYIHGIEIDEAECKKCVNNLSQIAAGFGISDVKWDIRCEDTLTIEDFNGKMDYVVGNPPYVRVHNLFGSYESVKKYSFAQNGMTDLFIVFYEIGLKMLNEKGMLGYISPSSLFNSVAASSMRRCLAAGRSIKTVVDLKHFQPFDAVTYTVIMILTKQSQDSVGYFEYDSKPKMISSLAYEDFCINGNFVFGTQPQLKEFKKIMSADDEVCRVKNGLATLCDKFFIDCSFDDHTIPIVKASTGKKYNCLFPYDEQGKLLPYETLEKNIQIKQYYEKFVDTLKNRSLENTDNWHGFGRSQGITDVFKQKYAINSLIRDVDDIKLSICPAGTATYSGLYILTDLSLEQIQSVLMCQEFINYVAMLGKYKNGGYYTYSSKDLQQYLNYKLGRGFAYEQLAIFKNA